MENTFIFSREHIIILICFATFMYLCPIFTKNLLPYSYIAEKILCGLLILEIVFEQFSLISMGGYDVSTCLPITTSRFCAYICIAILYFKQYQLFNIFFSWSLVCCIGEIVFFPSIGFRYPNVLYFLNVFSKFLLIYANVYMVEVRKFKVTKSAIYENLATCLIYFSFIFLLNTFTYSHYYYGFSSFNLISILIFLICTTLIYIPKLLMDKS